MRAIRIHPSGELRLDDVEQPVAAAGEVVVQVHAAAITRDELEWPADRLPAIPSYELAGTVVAAGAGVDDAGVGDEVYALTAFDRDGCAAELVAVAADLVAPRPRALDDVQSAALPMTALSAWQGLFVHGGLERGERVLITGASGGVGHVAAQLARWRGAEVVTAGPADLVFDTAGGEQLESAAAGLRDGGRLVSVAEEPPEGVYFVVEPGREPLEEIGALADSGVLRPEIDSVFALADAPAAFERVQARGKRGKVVLRVTAAP